VCVVTQQYNINTKTAIFFRKSSGIMYLALAVAPATWYNKNNDVFCILNSGGNIL
jgi:hypothetical protein